MIEKIIGMCKDCRHWDYDPDEKQWDKQRGKYVENYPLGTCLLHSAEGMPGYENELKPASDLTQMEWCGCCDYAYFRTKSNFACIEFEEKI